jgi:hypothetical protein
MVGAAGIVASTINNRHQRRESRSSQHGGDDHHGRQGSRATISDSSRAPSAAPWRDGPPSYTYRGSSSTGPPPLGSGGGGGQLAAQSKLDDTVEIVAEKLSLAEQVFQT